MRSGCFRGGRCWRFGWVNEREGWEVVKVSGSSVLDLVNVGYREVVRILLCWMTVFTVVCVFLGGFLGGRQFGLLKFVY